MPTVLCIAYLFPPRAGVGVQRVTKFVRYLPDFEWQPIVLTPEKPEGSFPIDPGYANEIPDSVQVFKAPSREPYHLYRSLGGKKRQDDADFRGVLEGGKKLGFMGRLYSSFQSAFLIPDPKIGWFSPAMKKAREILSENKIDIIFSTSPEATDHVVARAIARESKLPWVMDFRDPWTTSLYATKRPDWARLKEEILELSCLQESSAISVVQARYRDEYLEKYPVLKNSEGKFHIIPNGFDPNDFDKIVPRKFDKWTVVYTGSISYPRDPEPFFKGWKIACERSDEFRDGAGCLFMGEFDSRFHNLAPTYIPKNLFIEGFQTRDAVYASQLGAGSLLLIAEGYVTGKAYEYIASGSPILAITDGGDLIELIEKSRSGVCVSPSEPGKIADALIEQFNSRNKSSDRDNEYLNRFNRRLLTGELAKLFNDIIARGSNR
jgi:glycosyltransferase involved in cell wall biosynthesis